ncbi:MAG: MBL fold metallo-hydrolase [Alphaproteobacteria bacterium]|nr:MBL fold metallo-hydrolase [Alphaproteobacteria bacterium]
MTNLLSRGVMAAALVVLTALPALAQDAKRAITNVAGDVYRFQNNFHFALVVVTDDGVVVVDPINKEAAGWLKDNLSSVTDKPVTHLIYSHSHGDHASGGGVFADGAEVIAHANAPAEIDGVTPTQRFDDQMFMDIGGKSFELTWLGEGHGKDLIAVVVRPENVAFIVDAAAPKRLPFRDMPNSNIDGWIDQVRAVERLDFDIFAPGHGNVGTRADATDARIYLELLKDQVLGGLIAGKSVDDLVATITLEDYSDWAQFDNWREANIRGMARFLKESGQVN